MRTHLSKARLATAEGERANAMLRSCVHCGMCNAVCPTYQALGDELDGPRGRIYLIKGLLEDFGGGDSGESVKESVQGCSNPSGSMPDLPCLRDRLSVGGPLRGTA